MRPGRLLLLGPYLAFHGCVDTRAGPTNAPPRLEVGLEDLDVVEGEILFTDVRDMAAAPDGVWILDGGAPYVTWVDDRGNVGSRFGREGRGPAELLGPRALQTVADPGSRDLLVWDPGNARVTRFAPDGSLVSGERAFGGHTAIRADIGDVTYADPFRIRRVGASYAFARYPAGLSRTADLALGRIHLAPTPDLGDGAPFPGLASPVGADAAERGRELAALPLWDGCPGAELLVWRPGAGRLTWLDAGGAVTLEVDVPLEPRPLTRADIASYLRLMVRLETGQDAEAAGIDVAAAARSWRDRFAAVAPLATELRCGPGREAWLRLFDTSTDPLGRGRDWLVVRHPEIRRVRMPETFSPLVIRADRVLGVLEAPEGQRLAWWRRGAPGPTSPSTRKQEQSP